MKLQKKLMLVFNGIITCSGFRRSLNLYFRTMGLEEKVNAVRQVFENLDQQIAGFQSATSLHCKWGCGKCCFKPDIEATILEFLPFAFYLHQTGKAEEWLDKLNDSDSSICHILNPTQASAGLCSEYAHRGLICRLFGYSARTNKYGKKELVTCQIIKTEQAEAYGKATTEIDQGLPVPVMNQFYMQLHGIDFELTKEFYPINEAIKRAIEVVLQYFAYREG
jgi:Fe-S-cluster containining protein